MDSDDSAQAPDGLRASASPSARLLGQLQRNWKAGLTVSLVSLPLSISLAVAANASPVMGVITAMWAGLAASILGGCHFNIVGPTGALSGILAADAILYGVEVLPILAIASGVIVLGFYLFHLEKYILLIPSSVIHGFTLGVAFIIGLNQLNFALGLTGLPAHEGFMENVLESFAHAGAFEASAVVVFAVSLTFLFACLKFLPRIPGPILLAPVGILLGFLSQAGIVSLPMQTLFTRFGDLQMRLVQLPSLNADFLHPALFTAALAIAVIAMMETLISAKIADAMTDTRFDQRKELFGLGLANIASGLFGGIPATAALARTSLNIRSGATHRTSGVINSIAVGIIALLLLSTFKYLPLPIVAAILVYVAVRMVEAEHLRHIYSVDKPAFFVSLGVAVVTIVEDPMVGILAGAAVSLLMFVNQLSKGQSEITLNKNFQVIARIYGDGGEGVEQHNADLVVYRFAGQMTYINAQAHIEALNRLNGGVRTVVLNFRNLFYMDLDGLDAVEQIVASLKGRGIQVIVSSVSPLLEPMLLKTSWYRSKNEGRRVYSNTASALAALGFPAEARNPSPILPTLES